MTKLELFEEKKTFFDDIVATDRQRTRNRHPPSFDTDKNEFLCPLCRTISNTVIPLIPQFHLLQPSAAASQPSLTAQSATSALVKNDGESASSSCCSSVTESAEFDPAQPVDLDFSEWIDALLVIHSLSV